MNLINWFKRKINDFLYVKDTSHGKVPFDRSGEITIRLNSAADEIERKSTVIASNPNISIYCIDSIEDKIENFVYSHNTKYDGKLIAFIPFKVNDNNHIEVLVKYKSIPCWNFTELTPVSFTCPTDPCSTPLQTVLDITVQKTGYSVEKGRIINLGQVFESKKSDTIFYLFGVNLTDLEIIEETPMKKLDATSWMKLEKVSNIVPDAMFNCLLYRLQNYLVSLS